MQKFKTFFEIFHSVECIFHGVIDLHLELSLLLRRHFGCMFDHFLNLIIFREYFLPVLRSDLLALIEFEGKVNIKVVLLVPDLFNYILDL